MFFQDIAFPWWWASSHFSSPFFFFALICRRLPKIPVACFLPFLNGSLLWWYISKILKFLLHYVSNMIVQGTGAAVQDVINFVVNRHFGGGNLTGEVVTKQKAQWSNIISTEKVNCIVRNETGNGTDVSNLSSAVHCVGSAIAAGRQNNFDPTLVLLAIAYLVRPWCCLHLKDSSSSWLTHPLSRASFMGILLWSIFLLFNHLSSMILTVRLKRSAFRSLKHLCVFVYFWLDTWD